MTRLGDYLVEITGLLQFTLPVTPSPPFPTPGLYTGMMEESHPTSTNISRLENWEAGSGGGWGRPVVCPRSYSGTGSSWLPKGTFSCAYICRVCLFVFTMSVISFVILNVCVCLNTWSERSPITPTTQANVGPVVSAPPQVADSG